MKKKEKENPEKEERKKCKTHKSHERRNVRKELIKKISHFLSSSSS